MFTESILKQIYSVFIIDIILDIHDFIVSNRFKRTVFVLHQKNHNRKDDEFN